jgi:hypothetical protein
MKERIDNLLQIKSCEERQDQLMFFAMTSALSTQVLDFALSPEVTIHSVTGILGQCNLKSIRV